MCGPTPPASPHHPSEKRSSDPSLITPAKLRRSSFMAVYFQKRKTQEIPALQVLRGFLAPAAARTGTKTSAQIALRREK
jgi:hypothetical protein